MIGLSLSLSLAVAVAAMARQEGQTDKKGHTVASDTASADAAVG